MTIVIERFTAVSWKLCNRLLKAAYERLEPYVGKLTSTVLMGLGFSNEPWLPDQFHGSATNEDFIP